MLVNCSRWAGGESFYPAELVRFTSSRAQNTSNVSVSKAGGPRIFLFIRAYWRSYTGGWAPRPPYSSD